MRPTAKLHLFILALAVLLLLSGCNKLKARDELNKGVRAYKAGQFETAIEHFQRSIELDPNLLNARIYLATAYASQFVPGSPTDKNKQVAEAAINGFEKVLEADSSNTTALAYIAQMYFGLAAAAKGEEAAELLKKSKEYRLRLIQADPQNAEHYYSVGVIDWTLAYRPNMQMRADIGRRPDEPLPARQRRELAEQNEAIVAEGIDMLEKALEINPNYLDAIAYLNLLYRQKADIAETPREREQYLNQADEYHERYQSLREAQQAAPVASPAAR